MPVFWIILIVSGVIIITWPQIIAYMLWGLLLFFWLNIIFTSFLLSKNKKQGSNYVKFWNYKIYKD